MTIDDYAHPLPEGKFGHVRAQFGHPAHHLVPGNHWRTPGRQLTLNDVQVGPADGADRDGNARLISRDLRRGHIADLQRLGGDRGGGRQDTGFHGADQRNSTIAWLC